MHGNVFEWVADKVDEKRVCRSGGSGGGPELLRCAARLEPAATVKISTLGFRVCCDAPEPKAP